MMEPADAGGTAPRAFLAVLGVSLARHQLSLALGLGCERVICVARALDPELIELQHAAEDRGAKFHVVPGPRGLLGLISATDELIVLADGLLASGEGSVALLEAGPGVLVQPIESGLAGGFERIDLNHAAGGAMRISGQLVERLAELPSDCDVASSLQRIALQSGVSQRPVPASVLDGGGWRLVRDEAEAHAAEADWIRLRTARPEAAPPTDALVRMAVRNFGPALLHAGSGGNAVGASALATLLMALSIGWFGFAGFAFLFCAFGWILGRGASLLIQIERQSMRLPPPTVSRNALFDAIFDGVLIAIVVWSQLVFPWQSLVERAFAPVMLIALIRLVPRAIDAGWAHWLEDRTLLGLILGLAGFAGFAGGTVPVLAALLALLGLLWPGRQSRLTRV